MDACSFEKHHAAYVAALQTSRNQSDSGGEYAQYAAIRELVHAWGDTLSWPSIWCTEGKQAAEKSLARYKIHFEQQNRILDAGVGDVGASISPSKKSPPLVPRISRPC